MKLRLVAVLAIVSAALAATGCGKSKSDTTSAAADLRAADMQWAAKGQAKDLDGVVSFYADGAQVFPPNAPTVMGKQAIREMWAAALKEFLTLSWQPSKVEVADSGEMGYVSGTYDATTQDASGKMVPDKGKYLEVWQKQPDGSWKAVADMFSSDLAPPSSK